MKNFLINSESSGKYHLEKTGGRDFLVTQMLPIQAETVMNGLYYPTSTVQNSYAQLDKIPAPAGHPFFNGSPVSATDPEGASSFNVGAFVRSPVLDALNVIADLVIDVQVANRSPEGKEILSRIKNKKRIGISTGGHGKVTHKKGALNNTQYSGTVNEITFDHVAILLSQTPAGANTYTLNSSEFFNPPTKKGKAIMREITIDTANLSLEDHKFLEANGNDAESIVNALKHNVSESEAKQILTNAGKAIVNQKDFENFQNNAEDFKEFLNAKNEERQEQIDFVLANSKMEENDVAELSNSALAGVVASITPANKQVRNGKIEAVKLTALEGS